MIEVKSLDCVQYTCCFCNQKIASTEVDPCDLNIMTNIDKEDDDSQASQSFYCHVSCFETTLHEKIRGYLVVQVLNDENDEANSDDANTSYFV